MLRVRGVASSVAASPSATARAVTVWAVFQLAIVNVIDVWSPTVPPSASNARPASSLVSATVTGAVGCAVRTTVYVAVVARSASDSATPPAGSNVSPAASSSSIRTGTTGAVFTVP